MGQEGSREASAPAESLESMRAAVRADMAAVLAVPLDVVLDAFCADFARAFLERLDATRNPGLRIKHGPAGRKIRVSINATDLLAKHHMDIADAAQIGRQVIQDEMAGMVPAGHTVDVSEANERTLSGCVYTITLAPASAE